MKTPSLIAILASAFLAHADDKKPQVPVVLPVQIQGTATTSKFGDGYITRTSSGQTYTTSKFGDGTITRDGKGNTWTTSKFGDGSITRGAWLWHVCDRANLAFPKLPALWAVSSIVLFEMRSRSEWL